MYPATNQKLSARSDVYESEAHRNEVRESAEEGSTGNDVASTAAILDIGVLRGEVNKPTTASLSLDEDRKLSFEEIHRKYETKIFNLILRLVGNREDAEDLTVETFVNAFKSWSRFRGDARVSTWLHQIAVNNCKNRFKQRDRRREREPISLDDAIETDSGELSREVADWRNVPERRLLDEELARQIERAVDALAPEYRIVLVLAQIDELSYEEIAKITNLSVPAIKTRLHRARNMMRRRLEPYYRGWSGRPGV